MTSKYAPSADFSPGYIGVEALANPTALWGGSSWHGTSANPELGHPTLLAVVDLSSHQMKASLGNSVKGHIPLFSFINTEGLLETQDYYVDQAKKQAVFQRVQHNAALLESADSVATPLPEVALHLRPMTNEETPVDEKTYWQAIDTFLGGPAFVRICGKPLFADMVIPAQEGYSYFASIGYGPPAVEAKNPASLSFFVGELAFYFFVSHDWSRVRVKTQFV